MKHTLLAMQLLALVTLTACAPTTKRAAMEAEPQVIPTTVFERMLNDLIPRMSAQNLEDRQQAQRDFEQMCFAAGQPGREDDRTLMCRAICERLSPRTALPARIWMLRQLARISGEESVPILIKLLSDKEPRVRECARRALEENPSEAASAALRAALGEARDAQWQAALINALAARRDEASIVRLSEYLNRGGTEGAEVARAAIVALGEIGTPKAALWLNSLSREDQAGHRAVLDDARLRCAGHLRESGFSIDAEAIYSDLLGAGPVQVRMSALEGMAALEGQKALPLLMKTLGDPGSEYELAAHAIALTANIPGFATTITMAAQLTQAAPPVQALLLRALAERGDPTALPAVLAARGAADEDVRIAALRALALLGDSSTAMVLAEAAARTTDAERAAAREALAQLSADGVDDAMIDALRAADSATRVEIIRGLSARRCTSAIIPLVQEADGDDEAVAIAAFEALGELGTRRHTVALTRLLTTNLTDDVRAAAEDAVVAVCLRMKEPKEQAGPVLAVYFQANPRVHASLIRVLGRIRGTDALRLIRSERRSGGPAVVDAAVRALAKWPTAEVLDDLLEIARLSTDQTHRVLALGNYVRLLELPSERSPTQTLAAHLDAMALARRPEEQKLVLAGIAKVRHLDALRTVECYLREKLLREEAEAAVVTVAGRIGLSHPDEARTAVENIIAGTTNEATRERAKQTLETLRASSGCIVTWMVAGPYFEKGKGWEYVYDQPFSPEQRSATDVDWKPLATTGEDQPWVVDLNGQFGGDDRCVYVRCAVWSDQSREARLEIGSDDAAKVWLNGRLVHEAKVVRGHQPLEDKVAVTLNAGWNEVLLKVVQAAGGWGFSCAVKAPDGEPLDGLRFAAQSPVLP